MSQAEVKVKITVDGNAPQAMSEAEKEARKVQKAVDDIVKAQRMRAAIEKELERRNPKPQVDPRVKAEEDYQKRLRDTIRLREQADRMQKDLARTPVQRADDVAKAHSERESLKKMLAMRGLDESGNAIKSAADIARDRMAEQQKQKAIRAEMEKLNPTPKRGVIEGLGDSLGISGTAGALMTGAGIAGVAVAAAQGVAQVAKKAAEVYADAYATEAQKQAAVIRSIPIFGGIAETMTGLVAWTSGAAKYLNNHIKTMRERRVEFDVSEQVKGEQMQSGFASEVADVRAKEYEGYQTERPKYFDWSAKNRKATVDVPAVEARPAVADPWGAAANRVPDAGREAAKPVPEVNRQKLGTANGIDRSTVSGQRLYEEEMRMLPIRREQAVAAKDRTIAEKKVAIALNQEVRTEQELLKQRDLLAVASANAKKARNEASVNRSASNVAFDVLYSHEEKQAIERVDAVDQRYQQTIRTRKQTEQELAQAKNVERGAQIKGAEERYSVAKSRESEAMARDERSGAIGVGEFHQSIMALEMTRQLGEYAPPEMRAQAAQIAPKTVSKMNRDIGEGRFDLLQQVAPEDYKKSLNQTRIETDESGEALEQLKSQQGQKTTAEFSDALAGLTDAIVKQLIEKIDNLKLQIKNDQFFQNQGR